MDLDENKYYLEEAALVEDKDSQFRYETVPCDEFDDISEIDETLSATVRILQEASADKSALDAKFETTPAPAELVKKPPEIDDFILSYLLKCNMTRTLDCFQIERFELRQKGLLSTEDIMEVPDVYIKNQELDNQLKMVRSERDRFKSAAMKAREMYIKLRNERDYHKLQHRRVAQEKNKLIDNVKQLKEHYASYEPALQKLKEKYEVAMKEKMLSHLERDRALGQVNGLRAALRSLQGEDDAGMAALQSQIERRYHPTREEARAMSGAAVVMDKRAVQRKMQMEAEKDVGNLPPNYKRHPNDSKFPKDTGVNPRLGKTLSPTTHLTRGGGFKLANTVMAHDSPVSSLALHPMKGQLASSSDDGTWKLWSLPSFEQLGEGRGHTDWISSIEFNSNGSLLATGSGDTSVKLWDPNTRDCVHSFTEHRQAVWSVSWHSCDSFLASGGLEGTIKIWDLASVRCRMTLRGHAESVNSVHFLDRANILLAASGDKTLSLWDVRKAVCGQTLVGHLHSVNSAHFSRSGEMAVSCDAFGFVKVWDLRTGSALHTVDVGPHPANFAVFDDSGSCVAVASHEGVVKMIEVSTCQVTSLKGHEEAVHCCRFDTTGEFLVSSSSDNTVKLWS